MKRDELSSLLAQWQPENPIAQTIFVAETLHTIRLQQTISWRPRLGEAFRLFMEQWIPAPRVFMPAALSLALVVFTAGWLQGERQAKGAAAVIWEQQLQNPITAVSLSGAYQQITSE